MTTPDRQAAQALARRQHHNITRVQLIALGFTPEFIRHALRSGRLHSVYRGVYAVGRPHDTVLGRWMAAVLRCGEGALLSHWSAALLWGLVTRASDLIEVSVPAHRQAHERGIRVHRTATLQPGDATVRERVPVTSPARTLIDIAPRLTVKQRERAVNEADRL